MKVYPKWIALILVSLLFVVAEYLLMAPRGDVAAGGRASETIAVENDAENGPGGQGVKPAGEVKVETRMVSEQKRIDYPIEKVPDNGLFKGEQRILQKGVPGLELLVYEVVLEDGQETMRRLTERIQLKKPVRQVVAVGTITTAARGGNQFEFKEMLEMKATGYTHTGNRTSTDVWPSRGIAAVDPRVIPMGSRLYVDGYGYAVALDTGGAISGKRIDLFFETREEAMRWGRRVVKVFILK